MATPEVKRGRPEVQGVDPTATGLILIDVPLIPPPDEYWRAIFGGESFFDAPPGYSISLSMHPPQLIGGRVRLRAPDNEVEQYLRNLDERVSATNAEYLRRVMPELARQKREADAESAAEARRLEEAQRRLDQS